jgi:hypothetical protein
MSCTGEYMEIYLYEHKEYKMYINDCYIGNTVYNLNKGRRIFRFTVDKNREGRLYDDIIYLDNFISPIKTIIVKNLKIKFTYTEDCGKVIITYIKVREIDNE